MVKFVCGCGKRLSAPEEKAGLVAACPNCKRRITIPFPAVQVSEPRPSHAGRLFVLVAVLVVAMGVIFWQGGTSGIDRLLGLLPGQGTTHVKRYTREEFKKLVVGLTKDEVLKTLGKPHETQDISGLMEYWYYQGVTYSPVTNKTDRLVQLTIENGRVTGVNFWG